MSENFGPVLYCRTQPWIIEARSPSDAELEAECNVVGALLDGGSMIGLAAHQLNDHAQPIPFLGFGIPFHAACYYAAIAMELSGLTPSPKGVWKVVRHHPDAGHFGLKHLRDLAEYAVNEDSLASDDALLRVRAARLLATEQKADAAHRKEGRVKYAPLEVTNVVPLEVRVVWPNQDPPDAA